MCENSQEFMELFQLVVDSILDSDDEVASRAIIALSAFFHNPKIDQKLKASLINQVMDVIWKMLFNNDQLIEVKFLRINTKKNVFFLFS